MDILEIIGKITLCLAIAAVLGLAVGWFLAKVTKEEKALQKYNALLEKYEIKENEIRQLHEELDMKEDLMQQMEQQYQNCERERLNARLDEKDCNKYQKIIDELRSENSMLISQIKEQKICEDENQILQEEIKTLEEEKEQLLMQIDDCKEYKDNYKSLIMEIESLKNEKEKLASKQQEVAEGVEKIRIFDAYESAKINPQAYAKIKDDLTLLKEEATKIRQERDHYAKEIEKLRKKLDQRKRELKECLAQRGTKQTNTIPEDQTSDIIENVEIKSLSQLIKETLKDIKK